VAVNEALSDMAAFLIDRGKDSVFERGMWKVMYHEAVTPFTSVTRFFDSFIAMARTYGTRQQAIDTFKTVRLDAEKLSPKLPC
jgi:hypothetical protein